MTVNRGSSRPSKRRGCALLSLNQFSASPRSVPVLDAREIAATVDCRVLEAYRSVLQPSRTLRSFPAGA